MYWNKIDTNTDTLIPYNIPINRQGSTINYYNNKLYLIGGTYYKNGVNYFLKKITEYDINKRVFVNLNNISNAIALHSSIMYTNNDNKNNNDTYIVLFGGQKSYFEMINDIFIYNIKSNIITKINCDNKPPKRCRHTAIIKHNIMYIFGGIGIKNIVFNDSWMINIKNVINSKKKIKNEKWIQLDVFNHIIYGHSMWIDDKDRVIMINGKGKYKAEGVYNDCICIWNSVSDLINDNKHIGLKEYKYRMNDNRIQRVNCHVCGFNIGNKSYWFVFGGLNSKKSLNDTIILSIN